MKPMAVLLSLSIPYALAAFVAELAWLLAEGIGDPMGWAVYRLTNWRTIR